ncbi:MAG: hypothetical protein AB1798_01105 [Spirochaetota bacterium]
MKKKSVAGILWAILLIITFFSCEDVSVSVNSKGEVAFTRSEGLFIYDLAKSRLNLLEWNYGNTTIPVIIRWSPNDKSLAFTVRLGQDMQETEVYFINRDGTGKKKIYSTENIISQMEWSPDGKYLSIAQAGADSDMSVADLGIISVEKGMSKIIIQNTGDIHEWLDTSTIAYIKINEKNPDNSSLFKGTLSLFQMDTGESQEISNLIVNKDAEVRVHPVKEEILFTAIKAGEEPFEFEENMPSEAFVFVIRPEESALQVSDQSATFVKYSPDGSKVLIKARENETVNLALLDIETKAVDVLVEGITDTINTNSTEVKTMPAWYDNATVLYWMLSNTYGSSGQAIRLMSFNMNNLKKVNHQIVIDTEVNKLVQAKGGY